MAVTPIGLCMAKVSTRGKAAAVPVVLSDEELFTAWVNGWVRAVDERGDPCDVGKHLALVAEVDPSVRAKRAVFYDLWRHGYAMTNGLKFGVNFLAYRGDPTAVHAAFMVIVVEEGAGIAILDLVARSRVATTALKTCVVAWAGDQGAAETPSSSSSSVLLTPVHRLACATVRYAAFKRMGPGTALFADDAAQEAARVRDEQYFEAGGHNGVAQYSSAPLSSGAASAASGGGFGGFHEQQQWTGQGLGTSGRPQDSSYQGQIHLGGHTYTRMTEGNGGVDANGLPS